MRTRGGRGEDAGGRGEDPGRTWGGPGEDVGRTRRGRRRTKGGSGAASKAVKAPGFLPQFLQVHPGNLSTGPGFPGHYGGRALLKGGGQTGPASESPPPTPGLVAGPQGVACSGG